MIWDGSLTRFVATELDARLRGQRARRIALVRDPAGVVVYLRDATLAVDLSPGNMTVVLGDPSEPDHDSEPLPALVTGVEATRDERILLVRLRRVRGRQPSPTLVLELADNRRRGVLAIGPDLREAKRVGGVPGRAPPVGQPWVPPGAHGGRPPRREPDLRGWVELLADPDPGARRALLLRNVAHTSSINVDALVEAESPEEAFRLWSRMAQGADPEPHLLELGPRRQPYPWPLPGVTGEPAPSLLDAIATVRGERVAHPSPASTRLRRKARRLRRKLRRLRQELEACGAAARVRQDAQLILSSLHLIESGAPSVTLPDFDGSMRTIRISSARKPHQQADALFRRAARLERGAIELPQLIGTAEDELARVEELRERQASGEAVAVGAAAPAPSAAMDGRMRGADRSGGGRTPYLTFRSSGGLEIRVGRSARDNDDLTFRHSRPLDVWLHARHTAGAHVILRWTGAERPPAAELREAAVLAANHSSARGSGTVAVDWTRRKWVRKARRARMGAVVTERVETIFVTPDPELSVRLRR